MLNKINILGVNYNNVNKSGALEILSEFLKGDDCKTVVTPNAEIAQLCIENEEIKNAVNSADLILPDGIGVIYASKILKKPLSAKVAGVEIAFSLLHILEEQNKTIFLYGGKVGVADKAEQKINLKYPTLKVVGTQNGYFDDEFKLIEDINSKKPDVVFVCLGAPKQELFMQKYKNKIDTKIMLGLGGTLDILAGTAKRAPKIFVRLGLEWLYRLLRQPTRIKRMLSLPKYLLSAIFAKRGNI